MSNRCLRTGTKRSECVRFRSGSCKARLRGDECLKWATANFADDSRVSHSEDPQPRSISHPIPDDHGSCQPRRPSGVPASLPHRHTRCPLRPASTIRNTRHPPSSVSHLTFLKLQSTSRPEHTQVLGERTKLRRLRAPYSEEPPAPAVLEEQAPGQEIEAEYQGFEYCGSSRVKEADMASI